MRWILTLLKIVHSDKGPEAKGEIIRQHFLNVDNTRSCSPSYSVIMNIVLKYCTQKFYKRIKSCVCILVQKKGRQNESKKRS